jgi:sulfoacetaldehyde dehydrogenase
MPLDTEIEQVEAIVARARAAQAKFEQNGSQEAYDMAALAVGWAIMDPKRNLEMAELAVETTGLGNVADKVTKNHRKTLGLLRDISSAKTFGIIDDDPAAGITKGAVVPSTNPIATPANNIINALKGGNAIVLSPSPKGVAGCERLLGYIYAEFDKLGIDRDLVLMIPPPGTKAKTQHMLEITDLVVVTGSQNNVKRAYSSGTPAIGVGAGNVAVIVDETADLAAAAAKIAASKRFDNATSCSSENAIIVVEEVYDAFVAELAKQGGATVGGDLERHVVQRLWPDGHLNKNAIAKDADVLIKALDLSAHVPAGTKLIAVETDGIGPDHPLSSEKLSLVAALYRASDYDAAVKTASRLLAHYGAGHSVGLHSTDAGRPVELGHVLPTCRVIVNQAHCFATGGSFTNGLPFSLSMGCGSWGRNSIDENLHWKHFINITKVVREIPANEPSVDEVFGAYWKKVGK